MKAGAKYVDMRKLKREYATLCESQNLIKRKKTQLWNYVDELRKQGFVTTHIREKGVRGRKMEITLVEKVDNDAFT